MKKIYIIISLIGLISGCSSQVKEPTTFSRDQQETIIRWHGGNKAMNTSGSIIMSNKNNTTKYNITLLFLDHKEQEEVQIECEAESKGNKEEIRIRIKECVSYKEITDVFLSHLIQNNKNRNTQWKKINLSLHTKTLIEIILENKPINKKKRNTTISGNITHGVSVTGDTFSQLTGVNDTVYITSTDNKKRKKTTTSINLIDYIFSIKQKNSLDTTDRLSIQGERKKRGREGKIQLTPPEGDMFRLDNKIEINRSRKTLKEI